MMKNYEAIIIGGGGGLKLRPIADLGHKIAIIEKEDLGGTCLNRGCIPSKMLIHPAELMDEIREAKNHHIHLSDEPKACFEDLIAETTQSVTSTSHQIGANYEKHPNVDFYHGTARFVSDKVVEVNGEQLTANRIFIATGSRPLIPKIDGLKGTPFMTSREALRLKQQPKSMIVVGGGYIAVELGYFYQSMGTDVTFLVRGELIKQEDVTIREEFTKAFLDRCHVRFGAFLEKVVYEGGEFRVTTKDGDGDRSELCAEALFIATGVVPNSDDLGLENTGIELDGRGFIQVDEHLQTNVEGVYALGDVIGRYLFRHSVNFEGEYLLRTLYAELSDEPIDYPPMPHAIFSHPQVAGVGPTEDELREAGVDYVVGINRYEDSAMGGDVLKSKYGLVKVLFERESRRFLGAHIIGKEAATMIHTLIAFLVMEATHYDMLHRMIYIHPALPEVVRNALRKVAF